MKCLRENGQERAWFETVDEAKAFRDANPAYQPDVVVLCGRCGMYHCSNPNWLAERPWETPVQLVRMQ